MAVLGKNPRIVDAGVLLNGLAFASRAVFRLTRPDRSFACAWLLTDDLLVTPAYVADIDGEFEAAFAITQPNLTLSEVEVLRAVPVHRPRGRENQLRPALLRMSQKLPERALKLNLDHPAQDTDIWIVQYPAGQPPVQVSQGTLIYVDNMQLMYTADTMAGSGGSPVLDAHWTVIGMHMQGGWLPNPSGDAVQTKVLRNAGVPLALLMEEFRASPFWEEIARYHNMISAPEPAAVAKGLGLESFDEPDPLALLPAAVRWDFDPTTFSDAEREELELMVSDPEAERWTLRTKDRLAILAGARSLAELRKARGSEPSADDGQRAIDRILQGPPFPLDDVTEEQLSYWLQAVRWFGNFVPNLPTPADVNRALARLRVRSRLEQIAGPKFRGRAAELAQLRAWYDAERAGPMMVTGIGGAGKSALIAKFVTGLLGSTLLLWLDFDRADLAPDDAVSVLRLLYEQAGLQLDEFKAPPLSAETWQEDAKRFGRALKRGLQGCPAPLLVLDSFEVAQHARRHAEIWELLELVSDEIPRLHVLVSGRAPVPDLKLHKRAARKIALGGMAPEDATAWLRDYGVQDETVLRRVVELTRGVPLALQLAVRWLETGAKVADLPEALPEELIDGFLYRRILDRVIDPALKPVVRRGLVLRRLTVTLIRDVLADALPQGMDAQEVFNRLSRELGVVDQGQAATGGGPSALLPGAGDVLQLRPEVRAATLRLLETESAAEVRGVDERAAGWYAGQDLAQVVNRAELVYHRLRLGDVKGAEEAWRDECAPLLSYAADDLPPAARAARTWLKGKASGVAGSVEAWERDALARIRDVLGRGVTRAVPKILAERSARSAHSPLVVYDAWMRWRDDGLAAGRKLLKAAGDAPGPAGRDRSVLAALLAAEDGDRPEADRQLARLDGPDSWADRHLGGHEALAARAARVRLLVDLEAELALARGDGRAFEIIPRLLSPLDVVLPTLALDMAGRFGVETAKRFLPIPTRPEGLGEFRAFVDAQRQEQPLNGPWLLAPIPLAREVTPGGAGPWHAGDLELPGDAATVLEGPQRTPANRAIDLSILGWRRWSLATSSLFLAELCEEARPVWDVLSLAIAATLSVFAPAADSLGLVYEKWRLDEILPGPLGWLQKGWAAGVHLPRESLATRVMQHLEEATQQWAPQSVRQAAPFQRVPEPEAQEDSYTVNPDTLRPDQQALLMYLTAPDPLTVLTSRILGLPDRSVTGGESWLLS